MPAPISSPATSLRLTIRELGNVIPFKNRKRIGKRGTQSIMFTEPAVKKQMDAITDSFVSQVLSALATASGGTWTVAQQRSWIASRLPEDDCWTCVPDEHATGQLVPLGEEGADITIELIG